MPNPDHPNELLSNNYVASSASLPSATSGDAGKVVTVGSDGSYELGAGGSSTPGAMRCIAVDFAFDSPGIQDPAAGFVVYTPAVGEVILDDVKFTAVQIITAFDGTTPQLDAGVQSAGAWVGSGNWLDPTFADNAPTGTVASVGNGIGFTNGRIDVQTGTDALAIRLSDGSGNASGSTVGAGRIYLFVAVPTNPT